MNPLLMLIDCGQSYWLDNLTRAMIENGELARRVEREGLRGVTSNPSTFKKAIAESEDYDEAIGRFAGEGLDARGIYDRLVVRDVQDACDILRPVHDRTEGLDGFVSLEVSPRLAHDTDGTVEEARRCSAAVDRPNVFIKIPGTPAGVPAIEQMLYEGVHINVTLLFSIESYEAVANAYVSALERRAAEGRPVTDVASVASFFLSRIDVLVDELLAHRIRSEGSSPPRPDPAALRGKVALASAKLAYRSFRKIFAGERWKALEEKGARVQRPLWASTGTKNPDYSDVLYVEPLVGRDTVSTMPEKTIEAFADHGKVAENAVESDVDRARQVLADLEAVGVSLDCATWQLQNEGVQKFIDPFESLLESIEKKRRAARTSA